jgi:replicative DNA helicase
MLANATRMINHAARHATPDEGLALSPVDFLALTGRSTEPVIDGLLDHQERFIVVGGEGSGKTTALHQMAFALAAGQHPFCGDQIKPGRALIIDLENPVEILKRRFRKLRDHAMGYPGWDDANIGILARPGGIDLTSPGQAFKLAEVIRLAQPDLIIAGPIYKMLPGGEAAEWHHTTVTRFWDVMRARYDCAIGLETHAPMQSGGNGERIMRPLGSGVWSRWPEFGLTLASSGKHTLALKRFRGDREEGRSWPDKLVRNGQGGWPWAAVYPPGTFTSAPPAILG